jgi:hypothetical protein
MLLRPRLLALCVLGLLGCSSDDTPPAAAAPPPLPGQPAAADPAAPPQPVNPLQALQALSQLGTQAQQALNAPQAAGPVVNWRELAAFLPAELGGLPADGEVDGSTTNMQGLQVTTVKRRYKDKASRARIEITDTSLAAFLRAPFAMAAMVQEDSSKGYRRGTQIQGHPAIAEWKLSSKRSEAHVLVAGRFIVNLELDDTSEGRAETLVKELDLAGIAAAGAKAQAAAPAPTP